MRERLKGQMKLVPSGYSDCSFYSVTTTGENSAFWEFQRLVCWHIELSISLTKLSNVSILVVTKLFEEKREEWKFLLFWPLNLSKTEIVQSHLKVMEQQGQFFILLNTEHLLYLKSNDELSRDFPCEECFFLGFRPENQRAEYGWKTIHSEAKKRGKIN